MRLSYFTFAIFSLFLTACASKPVSYLPIGSKPIVNIEEDIAQKVELDTNGKTFSATNLTDFTLNVMYKLFWYDKDGVTQSNGIAESSGWQALWLQPKQKQTVELIKPTEESHNYRLYLRSTR
ncbi:YcfL family protein [Mannheimia bovis]|uniref:YcfL family protein n=1 Tax=Mannheimia bovis TaxID=2770636 RepID=A0A7H1C2K7_9PAST|nr:YcfL family protein [Mannheimia bovis]QNS15212.1 YcfL family protein [Mannheimia bovis]